ncbi:trans-sulfuration enzyme family protein [Stigmatella erecta]|uniref:Cystathionine gamma-lyase n=1 Tax=Stigmatella erecta TaxID=83460 RepID=A0A1I0DTN5_9BACT|nr:aminotransferase class I/II-fold pyridoxal phosphate-dependent enzyme [Stigmatella erecta]SET35983.1 cystathionine gamma-lyase [Stigmatella erecta]
MSVKDTQSLETICVHAGVEPDPKHGAIMTPIYQTSTYVQPAPGQPLTYDYSRGGNPTRAALETSLAALERAKHALSYASGLAAEQAIMQVLEPGARVIVSEDVYGGTGRLFRKLFARYGFQFDFLDLRDLNAVAAAVDNKTQLIWVETPTNPLLRIVDIAGICAIAKKAGAKVVVDNTFTSPIFQQPLSLGADLVIHSTTKYIGGHSDLIGGALMTNDDELAEKLRFVQFAGGAVNSPFECFMLLRSIKTLALRMERHNTNALAFARALEDSGDFQSVIYPGLESHPQHALARKQMSGFAGVVSVYLKRDMAGVTRFLQNLRLIALAESLGGVESLANHPEQMTHASVPPELRQKLGINAQLVRFSIGIENVNDLIADVRQALQR